MRRALPYALFGAVTLAVFWKFLLFGHTLHAVVLVENQLGVPMQHPTGWFRSERPHGRIADNISLLANHLRVYNEGLKSGELRLWNPSICCGVPLYADPMVHPFYPPQLLLHLLLPPEPAYEIFLLLHLFFSGAALFWLLRALGRTDLAATAGGLIWMLLGYNSMWFSTGVLAGASVWGPLTMLLLVRAFEKRDLSPAALAGVSMGLTLLGSHPQHALHVFLFSLGWLFVVVWRRELGWRFPLRASTVYVLLSVGVGLAALLTRLDTIANGFRNPDADWKMFYARPWTLPVHLLDAIAGKAFFPESPFFEYEFTVYAGLAAVALALAGSIRSFRDPRVRFLAIFGAAALAVAFLRPLADLLRRVPILNLSLPSRWIFISALALAVLTAYGWDALRERPGRAPWLLAAVTGIALPVTLAGIGPFALRNGAAIETVIGFALATGAAFAIRRRPEAAGALAFGALLFELLPPFLQTNWHADPGPMRRIPPAVELAQSRERAAGPWRGTGALGGVNTPDDEIVLQAFTDGNNLLALFGVENVAGFEAIMPDGYMNYATAAGGARHEGGRAVAFLDLRSRLVDAMNLKYAFLPAPLRAPPRFVAVKDFGVLKLYENTAALPRAWLVGRAAPARDEKAAIRMIRAPGFDPSTSVVLETAEELPAPAGPVEGRVTFTGRTPDRVDLGVSTKSAAWLVLADNDYPGWEATLDGSPAPILRANVAFRAVAVPAGEHAVAFRFRPESARHGTLGSAIFLALGLGFAASRRFRRAGSAPPEPPR